MPRDLDTLDTLPTREPIRRKPYSPARKAPHKPRVATR